MRIYFDTCCLCRPFDDQSLDRNHLEAEAILTILRHVHRGEWELIGSNVIDLELSQIASQEKKELVQGFLALQTEHAKVGVIEQNRAAELQGIGFRPLDALHIATAESAHCDVFLTTDDVILRKAGKLNFNLKLRVENPLRWIEEQMDHVTGRDDVE